MRAAFAIVVAGLAGGCLGGGGTGSGDGDDDDPDAGAPIEPEAPIPPAPPVLTPCPDGWHEVQDPGEPPLTVCEPWPDGAPPDCAADEGAFPGGGCVRIGTACPAGDFADGVLPNAIRVLAGAPAGGDGSEASPFGTIAEALDVARDGDVVALSKGTFDEAPIVDAAVTITGACVAETIVASSAASSADGTLTIRAGASVENLTVGGDRIGIDVYGTTEAVRIDGVVVDAVRVLGIWAEPGTEVSLSDVVVRDVRTRADGDYGDALLVDLDAAATVARLSIVRPTRTGIGVGGTLDATDVAILDVQPSLHEPFGMGLDGLQGGQVTVGRFVVENAYTAAIYSAAGGTFTATDLVVRGTQPSPVDETAGWGISFVDAVGNLSRALVESSRSLGVRVEGGTIDVSDLVVREMRPMASDGRGGVGIAAFAQAQATFVRTELRRNRMIGVAVEEPGTWVALEDFAVRDTTSDDTQRAGSGAQAMLGGAFTLARVVLERNRVAGLVAGEGCTVTGSDLVASGTMPGDADGLYGYGIEGLTGATFDLERVLVSGNQLAGVALYDLGTRATLREAVIETTGPGGCATEGCTAGGSGLVVVHGAAADLTSFRISDHDLCGVVLVDESSLDLHAGEIARNPIGANVQAPGFDLARLQDGVRFVDNDTSLDGSVLPVPDPVDPTDIE